MSVVIERRIAQNQKKAVWVPSAPDFDDTYAAESNGVLITAHTADTPGNGGSPSYTLKSGAGFNILTGEHKLKNSSGSATSVAVCGHIPSSKNHSVYFDVNFISTLTAGNSFTIIARGDTVDTDGYLAAVGVNASDVTVALSRTLSGVNSSLMSTSHALPTIGDTWKFWFQVHDNEKSLFIKKQGATKWTRLCWSDNNEITRTGRVLISALRNTTLRLSRLQIGATRPNVAAPLPPAGILWAPSYDNISQPANAWFREQEPAILGVKQDRMTITSAPAGGSLTPVGNVMQVSLQPFSNGSDFTITANANFTSADTALTFTSIGAVAINTFIHNNTTGEHMKVTAAPSGNTLTVARGVQGSTNGAQAVTNGDVFHVWAGDVNDSGGSYPTSRAEVYDRYPSGTASSVPPGNWPDPVGSERWYGISVMFPANFTQDTTNWFTWMQWKGFRAGSPKVALEADGDQIIWGGASGGHKFLGDMDRGVWHRYVVGMKLSNDPAVGWWEVWRDGVNVLPRHSGANMATVNGAPDPIYLKNGIYRTTAWTVTHTVYFGPPKVGLSKADVT